MSSKLEVTGFYEPTTGTVTYVAADAAAKACAIIDSVLDFDYSSGRTSTSSVDKVVAFVNEKGYKVEWILETHVHADHCTASFHLKKVFPAAKTGMGASVTSVQAVFAKLFNLKDLKCDGTQFDHLFADGEAISIGGVTGHVMYTPGHTPACACYVIGDCVFSGDTIFMPDMGSARCDFPGGSAGTMFASIQKLFSLPDSTRMFVGHDYQPGGREVKFETTIGEQKASNKSVNAATSEAEFTTWRSERDAQLGMPKLIIPSLQVNLRAGDLPPAEDNGSVYLKLPVNVL